MRPGLAASIGAVGLSLLLAGCSSGGTRPGAIRHSTTSSSATTTSAAPPTTSPPSSSASTTTTAPPPPFPAVVVQAMAQFVPLPAGAEAPLRLPPVSGYLTAQTGGLGGEDNVTLIATPSPVPVNSPDLTSSGGTELASFSTTPTASTSNASSSLSQAKGQSIDACGGPSVPETLSGGTAATSCPTLDGEALDWTFEGWSVQVITLSGTSPSTAEADQVQSALSSSGVPTSSGNGFVTVEVPANSSVGSSDTAAVEWVVGADLYQVRSSDNPVGAIQTAAAMRPYPGA
ncbi:MAG: hypothetical protein ACRDV4_07630 [Acidimicrobiales bacterium]